MTFQLRGIASDELPQVLATGATDVRMIPGLLKRAAPQTSLR
jgi:hypothetical protein